MRNKSWVGGVGHVTQESASRKTITVPGKKENKKGSKPYHRLSLWHLLLNGFPNYCLTRLVKGGGGSTPVGGGGGKSGEQQDGATIGCVNGPLSMEEWRRCLLGKWRWQHKGMWNKGKTLIRG